MLLFLLQVPKYRVVLLGDAGVGKTALVSQFMTSEYMNTYDASLGELLIPNFPESTNPDKYFFIPEPCSMFKRQSFYVLCSPGTSYF